MRKGVAGKTLVKTKGSYKVAIKAKKVKAKPKKAKKAKKAGKKVVKKVGAKPKKAAAKVCAICLF